MEACAGAHYWGRIAGVAGHTVKLIAPHFVKPYVKSNKNDRVDAQAIWEAAQRPNMRFVAVKTLEQHDIQSLHRIRSRVVKNRTALTNQIQGLLLEYGIITRPGRQALRRHIPEILEDADNGLTVRFRRMLAELYQELVQLDERVEKLDEQVAQFVRSNEDCQRLMTIPGIGPLGATALYAAVGNINLFKNGRELAAWLGLVPRQYSTGGKPRLLGISKRGDVYLRALLIHGARAALRVIDKKLDNKSLWAKQLIARRNKNVAAVAMANKSVRIAFALLKYGAEYRSATTLPRTTAFSNPAG
jgi:transposase